MDGGSASEMAVHAVQDVSNVIVESREVVGDGPPHTFQIDPPVLMHEDVS